MVKDEEVKRSSVIVRFDDAEGSNRTLFIKGDLVEDSKEAYDEGEALWKRNYQRGRFRSTEENVKRRTIETMCRKLPTTNNIQRKAERCTVMF